ncbi:hypothetical protein RB2083_2673 [Rhodobacteraceae bacterium HTCC2083]|nr:hypothetical protein RB2083_2673 [Rhodobacteraceae bacterium HTCC2083]
MTRLRRQHLLHAHGSKRTLSEEIWKEAAARGLSQAYLG